MLLLLAFKVKGKSLGYFLDIFTIKSKYLLTVMRLDIGGIIEGGFLIGCRYYGVSDPSLVNTPKWTIYTVECSHC